MLDAEPRARGCKVLGIRLRNDDATLVRRTQAGDEQAFAAIFERHHAPLLAYCRHMLGNPRALRLNNSSWLGELGHFVMLQQ